MLVALLKKCIYFLCLWNVGLRHQTYVFCKMNNENQYSASRFITARNTHDSWSVLNSVSEILLVNMQDIWHQRVIEKGSFKVASESLDGGVVRYPIPIQTTTIASAGLEHRQPQLNQGWWIWATPLRLLTQSPIHIKKKTKPHTSRHSLAGRIDLIELTLVSITFGLA